MSRYIGIDIGGTNMVCGLTDGEGQVLRTVKIATEAPSGSKEVIRRLAEAVTGLMTHAGGQVSAVGIGLPGFVDHVQGISELAVNLGWKNVPLADELRGHIGDIPVFLDNDVRMYVYGEAVAGAGRGFSHVLGVTIGTGMNSALVADGELYYGAGGRAGEIGHVPMEGLTYPCNCGMTGCLETAVSANGIARQGREAVARGERSLLGEWFPEDGGARLTAADVSRAYDLGDAAAAAILRRTGTLLGRGLAAAVTQLAPQVLIIGGGGAQAGERLLGPMKEELKRCVLPFYWEQLTVKTAERLEDAGVVGSALYAKGRLEAQAQQ
ncbi:ROK family protein [Paenibacillus mucilaginosus]|uniref:ROK family protein n=1 Tax=Paenibacillus mucilaginosus TaxID=61624 RepID=UPI001EF06122|nr:ROK family protein [Paenibacillus mucilaginosus]MCG7215678.1 ROK family protein [Paenibacillus mucilaginosus]WDM29310.1 ROK family protein [Paenibacillus mucilaginosus]